MEKTLEVEGLNGLSFLERSVLTLILCQSGEVYATAYAQLLQSKVKSRELTGVGGYTNFFIPPHAPFFGILTNGSLGGVIGKHPDLESHADFELSIRNGCVQFLEFVTCGGLKWPLDESLFTFSLIE